MKYETFEALINAVKTEIDRKEKQDLSFEAAFGGDTQIISDNRFVYEIVNILLIEYPHEYKDIFNDFIFMRSTSTENIFEVDGVTYEDSIQNLWLYLEGKLDERYAK